MFVNANQLKISPPPLHRHNSLPVLDMSTMTASQPVPLLQPLNVPRYMPHSTSHSREIALDSTPPQQQQTLPYMQHSSNNHLMMSSSKSGLGQGQTQPHAQVMDWPGPGSRIASLLPPEHLGTSLVGHLAMRDDYTPTATHMQDAQAYPYAQQNFWMGGHDQGLDLSMSLPTEDRNMNPELMKRRHVCPVCDKRFNRPSSLQTHTAVHTGAKPFLCNYPDCGRRFSVSSNLRRHEKTHNVRQQRESQSSCNDYSAGQEGRHEHESHSHEHSHSHPYSHSRRTSHMSHSSTSSFAGFSIPSMNDSRPGTAYSENHTPRQASSFSASLPSGNDYTPYQAYHYPLPQPLGPTQTSYNTPMMLPHPSASLPTPSMYENPDFGGFLHTSLPPVSARSVGMSLDSYQVVSGTKKPDESGPGGGTSRSSSASAPPEEALHTPGRGDEGEEVDGEGEQDPDLRT